MNDREALRSLGAATAPDPARLARVRGLMRARRRRPLVVGALALAAAALLALRPHPLQGPVATGDLTSDVRVVAEGSGVVNGPVDAPTITWTDGRLAVEVTPERGVHLAVETEEAHVAVIGTGFVVTRDTLGTRVEVEHGVVEVRCGEGQPSRLHAGDETTCLPVTPARRLGRVLTLRDRGTDTRTLLAELDAAQVPTGDPIRAELAFVRIGALIEAGRNDDAEAAAADALRDPGARAADLHRVLAQLRAAAGDCAGARPHVEWLRAQGQLTADDAACPE